jgi:hypothetical protein
VGPVCQPVRERERERWSGPAGCSAGEMMGWRGGDVGRREEKRKRKGSGPRLG